MVVALLPSAASMTIKHAHATGALRHGASGGALHLRQLQPDAPGNPSPASAAHAAAIEAAEESPSKQVGTQTSFALSQKKKQSMQDPCVGEVTTGRFAGQSCMAGWSTVKAEKGETAAVRWCIALPTCGTPPPADLRDDLVDIDIGTLGSPMASSVKLITFDPFDKYYSRPGYERFPTAIGPVDNDAVTFYVNEDERGCSSMNRLNTDFITSPQFVAMTASMSKTCSKHPRCRSNCAGMQNIMRPCSKPRRTNTMQIKATRLSTFLKERPIITTIRHLKIDAQGSDFSILQVGPAIYIILYCLLKS